MQKCPSTEAEDSITIINMDYKSKNLKLWTFWSEHWAIKMNSQPQPKYEEETITGPIKP
jgi:hypothetical protein